MRLKQSHHCVSNDCFRLIQNIYIILLLRKCEYNFLNWNLEFEILIHAKLHNWAYPGAHWIFSTLHYTTRSHLLPSLERKLHFVNALKGIQWQNESVTPRSTHENTSSRSFLPTRLHFMAQMTMAIRIYPSFDLHSDMITLGRSNLNHLQTLASWKTK